MQYSLVCIACFFIKFTKLLIISIVVIIVIFVVLPKTGSIRAIWICSILYYCFDKLDLRLFFLFLFNLLFLLIMVLILFLFFLLFILWKLFLKLLLKLPLFLHLNLWNIYFLVRFSTLSYPWSDTTYIHHLKYKASVSLIASPVFGSAMVLTLIYINTFLGKNGNESNLFFLCFKFT